jgi:hypothetical protein
MHGTGTYAYRTGETYSGEWVRGRREGTGVCTHSSGDVYDGEFRDDKEVSIHSRL